MIKHGPVDVVVLAAGEPRFDGSVLRELEQQAASGTIRVLDAMLLFKNEKGCMPVSIWKICRQIKKAALGFIETGTRGLFDAADAATLFEGMVPGSAVCRPGDRTCLGGQSGECHPRRRCGIGAELPGAGAHRRRGVRLARTNIRRRLRCQV